MNRRAQFVAVLVLVVGLTMTALYQQRYTAAASGGEHIKLLMVVKLVERDKVITEEMLGVREVPQAYVEDRAIKELERPKILGLRTVHTLQANETLMWTDLDTLGDESTELSSLVTPGSRALCIRTGRQDTSNVMIRPGDYVDIIGVMQQPTGGPDPYGARRPEGDRPIAAVVLLQRVLVLASGIDTSRDTITTTRPGTSTTSLLTLSLTMPEAQLITLATQKGRITVALRNVEDQRIAERIPDLSSNSLLNSKERDDIKGRRPGSTGAGPIRIDEGAR
jgi:pilus assembly protein CpaB